MSSNGIAVPDDATPAGRCPYCDRPFPTADRLALHEGQAHPDRLTAAEQAAVARAEAAEAEALGRLRLKAAMALVLVYFGLLFLYAIVT
jgi:hypothetical protein